MGLFSIWAMILYVLLPVGLVLLVLLTFPPIDYRTEIAQNPPHSVGRRWGKIRRYTNRLVEKVLFTRLGFLPADLINFLLFGLSAMFAALCARVYDDQFNQRSKLEKMLDVQLMQQGQAWRRQRNLYLTALALLVWYFVMIAHSLQSVLLHRNERIEELEKQAKGDISGIRGGSSRSRSASRRRQQPMEVEEKQD